MFLDSRAGGKAATAVRRLALYEIVKQNATMEKATWVKEVMFLSSITVGTIHIAFCGIS